MEKIHDMIIILKEHFQVEMITIIIVIKTSSTKDSSTFICNVF